MGVSKTFFTGVLAGIFLTGCLATTFPYKFYSLDADSYEGKLLGPEPKFDLPLSICKPTDTDKLKCLVVKQEEYLRMKQDYLQLLLDLQACQSASNFSP